MILLPLNAAQWDLDLSLPGTQTADCRDERKCGSDLLASWGGDCIHLLQCRIFICWLQKILPAAEVKGHIKHFSLTYTNQTQAELGLLVFCQSAQKLLLWKYFISFWTSHLFAQSALTCNNPPGFSEHFPCLGGGSRQLGTWFTSPGVVWTLFENTVYNVVNSFDCIRQILELDCTPSLHPLQPRRLFYP